MPTLSRRFNTNFFYHLYNCGVDKRKIFFGRHDYARFLETLEYYTYDQTISLAQFKELKPEQQAVYLLENPKTDEKERVKMIAYCLMPNHFHLLARPSKDNGVTRFAADVANSYTKFFNIKNQRVGNLLQGTFKAKEVSSEASLLQVSRYIHLNPALPGHTLKGSGLRSLMYYEYSSYTDWVSENISSLLDSLELSKWLEVFGGRGAYQGFVESKMGTRPNIPTTLEIEGLTLE